ncbi:hypothetical protein [Parabacteroides merdae]|jgi:hypothetical protein|uniref:hypothetical protein n=1 Tax=Parabacteroides merdae TaxID=46503 RepID=UPI0018982E38|nr:hypothetical protein [Parabacteroides merdae]MDB8932095.1 hypothetical protein [Parabacteroides merdae]MDB8936393.1 hypothetical protein [Parabacteroides merdae]MDB8940032.1 hypothetical protein [Parabacteroides merdae]MDB8943548.1 hypothetical protein [Parabacteroides merdae]MDB8947244.1 hypothetical protein [Parabacteroides merdae]
MRKMFLLLMSATMLLVTSCSKDENLTEESEGLALAHTEMTYEQILKGYTPEEMAAPKDEMTPTTTPETKADPELAKLLQEASENSYSKTSTRAGSINGLLPYMGVFKVKTCGNYPELKVFMDCEDGGNTNINGALTDSRLPGTWSDKNKNITMTFCVVMNDQSYMIPVGYGALYLVGGNASLIQENCKRLITEQSSFVDPNDVKNMPRMQFVEIWHDNEDHSNKNSATLNNVLLTGSSNELGDRYSHLTPRPTAVGEGVKNTLLTWMFPVYDPIKPFHPGFSYGVLFDNGPTTSSIITIGIDDENKDNKNSGFAVSWSRSGSGYVRSQHSYPYEDYYNGITTNANTTYKVAIIQ